MWIFRNADDTWLWKLDVLRRVSIPARVYQVVVGNGFLHV
jgi:hypothetical protein